MYQRFVTKFNTVSFTILLVVCALIPLIMLPSALSGLAAVKGVFLYGGVFLAFSFWLVAQFIDGTVYVPKHRALLVLGILTALSFISALVSVNTKVSLWGRGFVIDSFATILVLSLFSFLIAVFTRDQRKLVKLFLATFTGSVATIVLQIILYLSSGSVFIAKYFSHVASSGTLVGSWIDFAYFVTFTFILSLLMCEVLLPKGFFKKLSFFAVILCLIVLIFLNFKAAWIITFVSALLVFVYKFSVERSLFSNASMDGNVDQGQVPEQKFPIMSFIALLVGLFFFLSSSSIGVMLSRYAGISFSDFRPSISTTTQIMKETLSKNPLFGIGAGKFGDAWNLYRPQSVNNTIFWNTPFETGFSLLATYATSQGILVAITLCVLFAIVLISGFKLFSYHFPDRFSRFIAVTAFIMFIAFVGLFVMASPGMVLIVFGFIYLGMLLGVSTLVGKTSTMSLRYLKDPRTSFFAILILVVATMASFTATYFSGSRFASVVYFNRALAASSTDEAIVRMDKALTFSENDIYWRGRTALFTSKFGQTLQQENADKNTLQQYFSVAEQSANAAVAWDPTSSANWLALSQVYQLLASTSDEAYENAKRALGEAAAKNPNNPVIVLNQGQVELANKNTESALEFAERSLALKQDYLDGYSFIAAIKSDNGDINGAKNEIEKYISVAPFAPEGYMLLAVILVEQRDYQSALTAVRQARELAPNNANYHLQYISLLGLNGERARAIEELKAFKQKFPNIQGVDEQISRLEAGGSL